MDLFVQPLDCLFGNRVKELMQIRGLKASELARHTGMPPTTITRIMTGNTDNPSAKTLLCLAEFFNVSIDYLLGKKQSCDEATLPVQAQKAPEYIPIIDWGSVKNWFFQKQEILASKVHQKVAVSYPVSKNAFALITNKSFMKNIFPKGAIVIVDPDVEFHENDFVIASINTNFPTIREICEDSGKFYLNPVGINIPLVLLESPSLVFGTIIECRTYFHSQAQ